MVNTAHIAVLAESTDAQAIRTARTLAERLGVMCIDDMNRAQQPSKHGQYLLHLVVSDERLELREADGGVGKSKRGVFIDFSSLLPHRAKQRGGYSRKQPLGRAIGKTTKTVLDATAGLGHDAALLACMGFDVLAIERSPIIFALLEDGLRRAQEDEELRQAMQGRLTIINADARDVIPTLTIDAIYIDPMFPPKRKASALAKKEIRLVRDVVGADEDKDDLLRVARQHCRRVIVKRPTYAPPLVEKPTASIAGKLVRYDIYAR